MIEQRTEPPGFVFCSEATDQIDAALCKAQAEMPNAILNKVNPHFRSAYADLSSIREASLPSLTKHGVNLVQVVVDGRWLITRLAHKGQFYQSSWPLTAGSPQAIGSQLTYFRRYSWATMSGVAADEDDDAEVAEASKNVPRATEKQSAHKAHKNQAFETLKAEMRQVKDPHALKIWGHANQERIHALPNSWIVHFREEYDRYMTEIVEGVTEEGKRLPESEQDPIPEEKKK